LANISAMYAVYHGPRGLLEIGGKVHNSARLLALGKFVFSQWKPSKIQIHYNQTPLQHEAVSGI